MAYQNLPDFALSSACPTLPLRFERLSMGKRFFYFFFFMYLHSKCKHNEFYTLDIRVETMVESVRMLKPAQLWANTVEGLGI